MKETEAFRVLCSADRQILLHELAQVDEAMDEEELARKISACRHGLPRESIGEEMMGRAHARLYHIHFPLLRELDIIEQEGGEVALTDGERKDQLLDVASELEGWPPDDLLQRTPA